MKRHDNLDLKVWPLLLLGSTYYSYQKKKKKKGGEGEQFLLPEKVRFPGNKFSCLILMLCSRKKKIATEDRTSKVTRIIKGTVNTW